jgi:ankyrin repeat protein
MGHLSCAELLVQNGADVLCQANNGMTPLMLSAYTDRLPVAQYLLEQMADIHYRVA